MTGLNDRLQATLQTLGTLLSSFGAAAAWFSTGNSQEAGIASAVIGAGLIFVKELQGINYDQFQPILDELKAARADLAKLLSSTPAGGAASATQTKGAVNG